MAEDLLAAAVLSRAFGGTMTTTAIRYDESMSAPLRPATAADLLALAGDPRAEVVAGAIVEKAIPSAEHSNAQTALATFVRSRFDRRGGGSDRPGGWWILAEVDVEVEQHEVYRPDLVGWRRARVPERPTGRPVRVRPDWVCEVLSPSNATTDLVTKLRVLHRCGVPHYWIVDPERQILSIHRWEPAGYLVASSAGRGETLHPEPFDAVELPVGLLFGEDDE